MSIQSSQIPSLRTVDIYQQIIIRFQISFPMTGKQAKHHSPSFVDPGCLSQMRIFSFPDPRSDFFLNPGSRIRIKEFKYFDPKNLFISSRKYDPGCSSRIRILPFYPSRFRGPKRHRIPDPKHCPPHKITLYRYLWMQNCTSP
jgi:hypothetical protein